MAKALTTVLLDEVGLAVQQNGMKKTIEVLQESRKKTSSLNPQHLDFVLKVVSQQIGIPTAEIINGTQRTDERLHAVSLCTYFLHKVFHYGLSDLIVPLNKSKAVLSRRASFVEHALLQNPTIHLEKEFKNHYSKLNSLINKYLEDEPKQQ